MGKETEFSRLHIFLGLLQVRKIALGSEKCGKGREKKRGLKSWWEISENFIQFFLSFIVYRRVPAKV